MTEFVRKQKNTDAATRSIGSIQTRNGVFDKEKAARNAPAQEAPAKKKKLTYKEQREFEQLEKDLEALAAEKASLEEQLSSGTMPFDQLQAASERIGQIMEETDEKELRWLELSENM